jgi:hypothetical protein
LFRLQTADQIKKVVSFLNSGPEQIPGLIVMRLNDTDNLDANYKELAVFFNARPDAVTFSDTSLTGEYVLHPIQQISTDEVVKDASYENDTFNIPGRSTVVFVIEEAKAAPETPAEPAATDTPDTVPSKTITIAGIIAALLAFAGLGIFLRRRHKA